MSSTESCESKFDELLNDNFPMPEDLEPTVFDISGYPHYENVISNWYAFFLDANKPHGLGSLFYTSLRELVSQEGSFTNTTKIEREYQTNKNKRIDLLIHDGIEEGSFARPIIIECKINAELYNDLDDYYDSIKTTSNEDKKGIILSLHGAEEVVHKGFVIKTHQQLMDIINKNLSEYIDGVNIKYFSLFQDFMTNIKRLTRGDIMNDSSRYYFKNASKIDELLDVRADANLTVINQIYHTQKIKGLKWGRSSAGNGSFNFSVDTNSASYFIGLKGLRFTMEVWMTNDITDDVRASINGFLNSCKSGNIIENSKKKVISYRGYDVVNEDEYDETIINAVNKIEEFLTHNVTK